MANSNARFTVVPSEDGLFNRFIPKSEKNCKKEASFKSYTMLQATHDASYIFTPKLLSYISLRTSRLFCS